MPKGPPPKPTRLKLIEGNPGKRPLNEAEPKPPRKKPYRPSYLSDHGRRLWNWLVDRLFDAGIVVELDRLSLELLVEQYGTWRHAQDKLNELMESDAPQCKIEDWHKQAQKNAYELRQLLAEFGLTPSSRSRIIADLGDSEVKSDLSDLLTGGG